MDKDPRREQNYNVKVQSYGAILSQNARLKKKLCLEEKRKETLLDEIKIQGVVIDQLKNLLNSQTKPKCELGHRWCRIDHHKYNLRVCQSDRKTFRAEKPINVRISANKQKSFVTSMSRKLSRLQSNYGFPPLPIKNFVEDQICPDFLAIWENIAFFQYNVLDRNTSYQVIPLKTAQKPSRKKYHHSTVMLESRPHNIFKSQKHMKQNKVVEKHYYEPMTDSQLAAALNLDEEEIAGAFGYNNVASINTFHDGDYELDTNGLELIGDGERDALICNNEPSSEDDIKLAAQFGYYDGNSATQDFSFEYGYGSRPESSHSDKDLAIEFGYGHPPDSYKDSADNISDYGGEKYPNSSNDEDHIGAEFGYADHSENSVYDDLTSQTSSSNDNSTTEEVDDSNGYDTDDSSSGCSSDEDVSSSASDNDDSFSSS